ncbi:glycosyltransferase family 4 protein [bacterium]|nr:glycosyltransferase family 4 protein [bacterium]
MTKRTATATDAATRPLRVAMIGQKGYPPIHGGIEKHVAELAARLPALGCAVDIYSRPHYSQWNGPADLDGVRVRRLPSVPTKHLDAISHTMIATADVLWRDVDIVHYHALGPGLLAGVPRVLGRKATVVTVHGLDWQRDKWGRFASWVLRVGEKASAAIPSATVVVSKALRAHYLERYRIATHYIPNGIVPPRYREPAEIRALGIGRPFVLFVGRLVPEKGCHLLLEAWRALPSPLRETFALVVAGDAGFTTDYVAALRRDAPAGVHFVGYVHGPVLEELFSNAAVMVLPSTLEGLSITLLEGMSYQRCCLVSDIPPNVEAAGGHALLFPSGDAGALRDQLARALGDEGLRERLGAAGQVHAIEHYSWDRVAGMTAAVYGEVLGR